MTTPPAPNRRKPLGGIAVVLIAAVVAAGGAGIAITRSYHASQRREAYLPELVRQSDAHPEDGPLAAMLAVRLAEAGEYPAAAGACERAVGAGIHEPSLFLTWASSYAAAGQADKARGVLQYAIGAGHCNPPGPARDALSRLNDLNGRSEASGKPVAPQEAASVISPEGTRPLFAAVSGTGDPLSPLWDFSPARHPETSGFFFRQRQAAAHPDDPMAQVRWSEALRRNRRLREAEAVAAKAVERWPEVPEARLAYGDTLFAGHVYARAGLQYKAALAQRPDWLPALKGLGAVGVEISLYRISIENYEKAVKIAPNDVDAWIGLGRARLQEAFRLDRALEAFQNAAKLAPQRTDFYPYYADALTFNYKADEAEALLRRRLQAAPDDARSCYLLANLLIKNKATPARTEEAERLLRESLRLESDAPVVKVALAQILVEKGTADAAADAGILLAEALDADPRNTLALRLLAQAYRRIGRADRVAETEKRLEAITQYNDAVRKLEDQERAHPDDISIHSELARLYAQGGESDKAKRQDEMAYMLRTHPDAAKRGLITLMGAVSKTESSDIGAEDTGSTPSGAPQPAATAGRTTAPSSTP